MPKSFSRDLFRAAATNDEQTVRYLVEEEGIFVNGTDYEDRTIAHIAAENGHSNIVKYVVERDPSILNVRNYSGDTVFFEVIKKGNLELVKFLIKTYKIDTSKPEFYGLTPVHQAAQYGHLSILKYFIDERKVKVEARSAFQQTPIMLAAKNKHSHVVKYLIEEKNADPTVIDINRHNLLDITIDTDDLALMKYLLDERKIEFDINWRDVYGISLVNRAALLNRLDLMKYLVDEKKADVNTPDYSNNTPLHNAARKNYYEICKFLMKHKANVEAMDDNGNSPFFYASDKRVIELLEKSLKKRERRSVSAVVDPSLMTPPSSASHEFSKYIENFSSAIDHAGRSLPDLFGNRSTNNVLLHNIFTLAEIMLALNFGYWRVPRTYDEIFSPENILKAKMSFLAIEAANAVPSFKEIDDD